MTDPFKVNDPITLNSPVPEAKIPAGTQGWIIEVCGKDWRGQYIVRAQFPNNAVLTLGLVPFQH